MYVLTVLILVAEGLLAAASLYLLTLTIAALFYRRRVAQRGSPTSRFAILVPAHDEELSLPRLLTSLNEDIYPLGLRTVFVVADNCSDGTAQVGRRYGAAVFERSDASNKGKGQALRWLLQAIQPFASQYDAYVIVDADCVISPNFLSVMDARLRAGSRVIQSNYAVSNPSWVPVAALRLLAFALMHLVRSRGLQALGLSCGLYGTGMVFRKDVLNAYPWGATSLAEDIEFYLYLTRHGIKVDFAPEAVVSTEMPTSLQTAQSQNLRWEKGRLQMFWTRGVRLIADGLLTGNIVKVDAGLRQGIPPLSLLAGAMLLSFAMALIAGQTPAVMLGILALAGLLAHVVLGLFIARVPVRAWAALAYSPVFVAWKVVIYLRALWPTHYAWVRTERTRR